MIKDAQEIRAIAPNIMVKVPASTQGVEVVKAVTALGIPTNVTTCFTFPQIWAVAQAAAEGVKIGQKNGVDMSKWRAVITHMMGRLIETPALDEQAARRGITLTWSDKHWFTIYVFREAFKLLKETGMPSKMLACSMREGPLVGDKSTSGTSRRLRATLCTPCRRMSSIHYSLAAATWSSPRRFSRTTCRRRSSTR